MSPENSLLRRLSRAWGELTGKPALTRPPAQSAPLASSLHSQYLPTSPPPATPPPPPPETSGQVGPAAAADIQKQLKDFRDTRIQRWILYLFLMGFSAAFLWLFLHIVCTAWDQKTEAVMIQFAKLGPSTTALLGALVAAIVAIPLSLCLTLAKMVSAPKQTGTPDDSDKFTSALFELGKSFAQGFKSLRGE